MTQERSAEQALAAASFVPPLARRSIEPITRHEAAVLFVDAADFTASAGTLVESGPEGVERLSALLDRHYRTLLQAVAAHGGEAVRFVGDALLAVFLAEGCSLEDATLDAAAAAATIQAAERTIMPDGRAVEVRALVTAGTIVVLRGDAGAHGHFVLSGAPIDELATAAGRAAPGLVTLGPSAVTIASQHARGHETAGGWVLDGMDALLPRRRTRPPPPMPDLSAVSRFVPPPVLARIETGHLAWLAELRRVTAVFVSVRGLGAAAVTDVLADAGAIADRHELFLKEVILDDKGWTLVALTGVPPFTRADDAVRAVRFARDLGKALAARGLSPSAGVAGGRAFCGAVGSVDRREYAIVGSVMNLASRLAQSSGGGQIACDEETSRAARGQIHFEPLPPRTLKGFKQPVTVFAPGADLVASVARGALVGRDEERVVLADAIEVAVGGAGGPAVVLEGEPGIGKSHLAREAMERAAARGLSCIVGAAESVNRSVAYHPWRAVFRELFASGAANAMDTADAPLAPLLEAVLPLGLRDNEVTAQLTGQVRAQATLSLLVRVLARRASASPMAVLLEDGHWADAASWDLLLEVARARPPGLLLLLTSRSDKADSLDAMEAASALRRRLAPLPESSTATILAAKLGAREADTDLAARVHERAAGNPLFVEQLALSLSESGAVRVVGGRCFVAPGVDIRAVDLPATLAGAITARLDRLSPSVQLTLKVASVVGRGFSRDILSDVHPRPDDRPNLTDHLATLIAAQLVERDGEDFRFPHELVRDVVYGSMLFEQRRVLHRDLAAWYESRYAADLSPHLALLAHHHRNAGQIDRAVEYLERESIRAFSIGLARQSVTIGIDAAGLLGVALPADPAAVGPRIGELVGATEALRRGRAPAELLTLPPMTDPATQRAVKLLLELAPFTFQAGRPELYVLIALLCLERALEHGNGPPDVYSTYSVAHRAIHHDAVGGYAWSQLARALDQAQGGSAKARVTFVHGWFHSHWVRPLRDSIPESREAASAALESGDVLFGCYNLSAEVVFSAAAGTSLDDVIALARDHLSKNGRRVVNAAFHCAHEMQVAKAIAGRTASPLSLTDEEHDEERDIASICATDYYNQIGYYLVSRVKLHALFGDPRGALEWAVRAEPLYPAIAGQMAEIELVVFRTLASLDAVPGDDREALLASARSGADMAKAWAAGCADNFRHLDELLSAAVAAADGEHERAAQGYARAAAAATEEGFLQYAAIAEERAFTLARGRGLDEEAEHAKQRAVAAYERWGARAKATALAAH